MAEKISNQAVAKQFYLLALVMDILEEKWRANTYRKAARKIEELSGDLEEHWLNGELTKMEGVGESIAAKIGEFYETGRISALEDNRHMLPEDLDLLLDVPSLGERRLSVLIREAGVRSIEDLLILLSKGTMTEYSGFTQEIEEQVATFLRWRREESGEIPLPLIIQSAEKVKNCLKADLGVKDLKCAGAVRRRSTSSGNVTILFVSDDPETAITRFGMCPEVDDLAVVEKDSALGKLKSGAMCMLKSVSPNAMPVELLSATGSDRHIQQLKKVAKQNGLHLTPSGLFKDKRNIEISKESEIYEKLGLPFFPPGMREGRVDVSSPIKVPQEVDLGMDYRGDLHVNSDFSNGSSTISDLAYAAKYLGLEYICLADRLGRIPGRLHDNSIDERNSKAEIVSATTGVKIIKGIEIDVKTDGSLDASSDAIDKAEFVIAGIHDHLEMEKKDQTRRMLDAIKTGSIDAIAHPTNRIIGYREKMEIDLEKVASVAAENGVALEVNSSVDRLDLSDEEIFMLRDTGAFFFIGSGAHSSQELSNWRWGAIIIEKGLLDKRMLLNRLDAKDIVSRSWKRNEK